MAGELIATGLAASPGAARGVAVFDAWRALDAVDEGRSVILVATETSPADEPALSVVAGVVTSRGGMGSHAAVIARGRGLPAVCGAHPSTSAPTRAPPTTACGPRGPGDHHRRLHRRDPPGPDRRSDGRPPTRSSDGPTTSRARWPDALVTVLGWADDPPAGSLAVLANADTAADAARARRFGAEGIGLCRTEHQFLAPDRLDLLRRLILAPAMESEAAALDAADRGAARTTSPRCCRAWTACP